MSDFDYMASMAVIQRERRTEDKVRSLDADDIVKWVHELEDQIERNDEQSEEYDEEITTLRADRDRLKEALRPFADPEFSRILPGNAAGEDSPVWGRNSALLTIGDFRKARQALQEVSDSE